MYSVIGFILNLLIGLVFPTVYNSNSKKQQLFPGPSQQTTTLL